MLNVSRSAFGRDFVFGVSASAYQIEGGQIDGRGSCIWDTFSAAPGNVHGGDCGRDACDHYHRWAEDLDLIRDGGFGAYRFSFAWPRLFPEGTGAVNSAGIDFYDRLIDGMLARGLKPFATLYHWDLPSALQDRGGWMNRDVANWFADYAVLVQQRFGDRLATIATLNEPWCVAYLGHFLGVHAPGLRDWRAFARAMHHVLVAHGTAVKALRAEGAEQIGIVLNLEHTISATDDARDRQAARLWDGMLNRWYLDGVLKGRYPEDVLVLLAPNMPDGFVNDLTTIGAPIDWLGINYYTRGICRFDPTRPDFPVEKVDGPLEKTDFGWEICPEGLEKLALRVTREYSNHPLYVTENGMAEVEGTNDPRRVKFHSDHLQALLRAKQHGANVRGYFCWSLFDNFEWAEGYAKRFGLVHVDYATQVRTPKASYRAFRTMLRAQS